ncbi:hypothetical protein H4Q26_006811 [Puccinia striiformis f. sp. tritici PST-130]|nr:hypothetical protein H4Q26_006811 [Puccinia striiformis f. sp. tritici PST-130]
MHDWNSDDAASSSNSGSTTISNAWLQMMKAAASMTKAKKNPIILQALSGIKPADPKTESIESDSVEPVIYFQVLLGLVYESAATNPAGRVTKSNRGYNKVELYPHMLGKNPNRKPTAVEIKYAEDIATGFHFFFQNKVILFYRSMFLGFRMFILSRWHAHVFETRWAET